MFEVITEKKQIASAFISQVHGKFSPDGQGELLVVIDGVDEQGGVVELGDKFRISLTQDQLAEALGPLTALYAALVPELIKTGAWPMSGGVPVPVAQ